MAYFKKIDTSNFYNVLRFFSLIFIHHQSIHYIKPLLVIFFQFKLNKEYPAMRLCTAGYFIISNLHFI